MSQQVVRYVCQHGVGMGSGTMTTGTGWGWRKYLKNLWGWDELSYVGMGGDRNH